MTLKTNRSPFDYVKSIQKTKENLIKTSDNKEQAVKEYLPFIVNKALAFYVDSILYANEMNLHNNLDNDLQYDYYLNSVRKQNRVFTWFKKDQDKTLDNISNYYSVNRQRAREICKLLTVDEIKSINSYFEKLNDEGEIKIIKA